MSRYHTALRQASTATAPALNARDLRAAEAGPVEGSTLSGSWPGRLWVQRPSTGRFGDSERAVAPNFCLGFSDVMPESPNCDIVFPICRMGRYFSTGIIPIRPSTIALSAQPAFSLVLNTSNVKFPNDESLGI